MIDRHSLLKDLQRLLKSIEADLLERSDSAEVPDVGRTLREEFSAAQAAERTAQNYRRLALGRDHSGRCGLGAELRLRSLSGRQRTCSDCPRSPAPENGSSELAIEHEIYFRANPLRPTAITCSRSSTFSPTSPRRRTFSASTTRSAIFRTG